MTLTEETDEQLKPGKYHMFADQLGPEFRLQDAACLGQAKAHDAAVIVASHDLRLREFADRTLRLQDGTMAGL